MIASTAVGDVEPPGLGGDLRVEHALEQHVAELGRQRIEVAAIDGLDGFVSFFEQVRAQRFVRLLAVPGTAVR